MIGCRTQKRIVRRVSAFLLAMILPLAGLSFGEDRGNRKPAGPGEETRLSPAESSASAGSGQIQPGSRLAQEIERRYRIRILIPSGEVTYGKAVILGEGIASKLTDRGDELADGYNPSTFIPWSDVLMIRARRGNAAMGALIGMTIGAGIGALGALTAGGMDDGISAGEFLGVVGVCAAVGSVPGVFFGGMFRRWKTIYVASAGPATSPRISLGLTRRGGMGVSVSLDF